MNLIDRYVAEVGKHLPRSQRADIEKEIRSTLQDMLEERRQPGVAEETQLMALLKEYGAPRKVAESYVGPRYVIGPRMYPMFELVTKIVMAAVTGAGLLGFVVSNVFTHSLAGPDFLAAFGQFWVGLLGGLISAFGNIVIVFAILERVLPAGELEKAEAWDPADLAKEPDPDEVKVSESVMTILFTVLGLVIFNLYPNVVGLFFNAEGCWTFIPILSPAFFRYLPWINLLGVLQIGFHLYQLQRRTWTPLARGLNILLEAGSIVLAVVMLTGPALIDLSAERLAGTALAEAAAALAQVMRFVPSLVLTIVIVISTVELVQMVYRLINRQLAAR